MTLLDYGPVLSFGDFADLYLEDTSSLLLRWEDGRIESVAQSEESGAGLRYLKNLETRYGHVDLANPLDVAFRSESKDKLEALQKELRIGLPSLRPKSIPASANRAHAITKNPSSISLEEKMDLLKRAHAAALKGTEIRQINVNYGERIKKVGYINSDGESFIEERIYLVFGITVTAEKDGDLQTAYESLGGLVGFEIFDQGRVEKIAAVVADRAKRKLMAPPAPAGEMAVVIASTAGGTLIHEAIGHSLEADAVLEGTSPPYAGRIGQVVGHEKLTVYDDPTVPGKRGSFFYDDEGVPSEPTKLIDKGVLQNYLYDRTSARRAGLKSNGHGRRESYAHRPIPRMSNTFVAPGPDDPMQILNNFKDGLLVTKMGGGQVNTVNGDFVFDVEEGYHVKDGKTCLVRGATLLGNGPEVLKSIDQVGSDHGWAIGTCGKEGQGVPVSDALPTVHIKKMVIGGQGGN